VGTLEEKRKHKDAAFKAWETIRSEKRKKAAEKTEKITRFITTQKLEKIKHPELFSIISKPEPTWAGNRIVVPFDKTPPDIACGRFWELRWAYGCPFNCNYCFLRGTMRGKMKPQFVRTELVLQALDDAFERIHTPSIFNAGELCDSLMNPLLMKPIVDKFEEQNVHKIYLLSKFGSSNITFLTDKPRKQVICGWSINIHEVAKRWETNAASPEDRIRAATLVSNAEYDTRIRIDPIFPINDWKVKYSSLLDQIFSALKPSKIILGTPRGLWKTIQYAREAQVNMDWAQFFAEDSSWGKKIRFEQRKEIYEFFFTKLEAIGYPLTRISLCKETLEMWTALGIKCFSRTCNCYGSIMN
jgi:spore photoproduct lyase